LFVGGAAVLIATELNQALATAYLNEYWQQRALFGVGVFLLLLGGVAAKPLPMARIFHMWWLQLVGMMCYSLYVWHVDVQSKFLYEKDVHPVEVFFSPLFPAYLVAIGTLGWLSYRYIEFRNERDVSKLLPKN
jgi:peptidoglycan/LPS O-acetylase OafA/YrhL